MSRARIGIGLIAACLLLASCAGGPRESPSRPGPSDGLAPGDGPRMIAASGALQCVPYARHLTGLEIRGDAWTWWRAAEHRFERNDRPAIGAVLVLKKTTRLRYGHLSVVTGIVSYREVLVEHANWLNRGRIHKDIPVRDVSPNNDWSAVRVWYVPGQTLGRRTYPAHGFIHPQRRIASSTVGSSS